MHGRQLGPGRTFMWAAHILGDKDPKDPLNSWKKTWAYLAELPGHQYYRPAPARR
jgi:putative spermidine/putrescine transport system substrate-binding protein